MRLFPKVPRSSLALIAGIALFVPGFADAQIFFATRPEPPFAIAQGVLLVVFVWLGIVAARNFQRPAAVGA